MLYSACVVWVLLLDIVFQQHCLLQVLDVGLCVKHEAMWEKNRGVTSASLVTTQYTIKWFGFLAFVNLNVSLSWYPNPLKYCIAAFEWMPNCRTSRSIIFAGGMASWYYSQQTLVCRQSRKQSLYVLRERERERERESGTRDIIVIIVRNELIYQSSYPKQACWHFS